MRASLIQGESQSCDLAKKRSALRSTLLVLRHTLKIHSTPERSVFPVLIFKYLLRVPEHFVLDSSSAPLRATSKNFAPLHAPFRSGVLYSSGGSIII